MWILARPKVPYYGAYPSGFLERARALLGITPFDALLHVCGGAARLYPAKPRGFGPSDRTLDLDAALKPDYVQSAADRLPAYDGSFDPLLGWPALLADPPYTEQDAAHYTPGAAVYPAPNVVLKRMLEAVRPGGRVGLLHYVIPRPPATGNRFVAVVGVFCGFGNRMRAFSVFERED
jgi:hypothetical protein